MTRAVVPQLAKGTKHLITLGIPDQVAWDLAQRAWDTIRTAGRHYSDDVGRAIARALACLAGKDAAEPTSSPSASSAAEPAAGAPSESRV